MIDTSFLRVLHEAECPLQGDLCACVKKRLMKCVEVIHQYQDEMTLLRGELNKWEIGKHERKKKEKSPGT